MLLPLHKKLILKYVLNTSVKSLLEDIEEIGEAYENGRVRKEDIYEFLDEIGEVVRKELNEEEE